jgi:tRNA(Ser,Leu) C12 N-acetylase TAN1
MHDWNVVVTLFQDPRSFRRARNILRQLGEVSPTEFHNVLVMRVENLAGFLRDYSAMLSAEPGIQNDISRAIPLMETFEFRDREEFEDKARAIALSWVPRLKGLSFYVRLHRRGLKGALQSPAEERFLDEALLAALEEAQAPGRISFEEPDAVIDIESIGHRAGMSLWTREDLARYPFLRVD